LLEKQPNIQEKGPDFPNKVVKKDVEKNSTVLENSKNLLYSIQSVTSSSNEIIIDFNVDIDKNVVKLFQSNKNSLYKTTFDINGYLKDAIETKLKIEGVNNITLGQIKPNVLRLILNSDKKITPFLKMRKRQLVITINNLAPNKKEISTETERTNPKIKATAVENKALPQTVPSKIINKTIVIDAGHGGDDVGAVGPNKEYEKTVNIKVSQYLYSILKQRGYKVYLTRNNDNFIKVMDRTILANEKNADIFISVHTNAVPKEKANQVSGIETFFLSPARSERAKRVAALENKSDIREMSDSSKDVFLESLNRPRITASHKLAIDVQAGLLQSTKTKYKDIKDSGVREGPFWVLVGAQMPSILVELGYISHNIESKRLYNKEYQQLLANGIANGVDSYFSKNP
jgi:N-acetylmuramoyl-L-alanine amidase